MTGFRVFAFVTAVAVLTGCGSWQAPQSSDIFDITWEVQERTRTSPQARLFVTDSGFWAYVPEDGDDFDAPLSPGELLVMESDGPDHVFAVVKTNRWGYLMQRLGDHSLPEQVSGDLRHLTAENLDAFSDLCIVSDADELDAECGLSHHHRRWHLYDIDNDSQSLGVRADFERYDQNLGFPIVRHGLAGGDLLSRWTETTAESPQQRPLLAIRSETRVESTLRATVAYDSRCTSLIATSSRVESVPIDVQDRDSLLPVQGHPVAVESAALTLGADAIVDCTDGSPRLLVAMLSRPLLRDGDGRYFAPPSLGLIPRRLHSTSDFSVSAWANAGALVAVGDTPAASFWIEQALADEVQTDSQAELTLASMPILASAGQPELAMRVGNRLTRRAWNPENIPDYLDGLIVLLGQFGDHDDLSSRIERRQSLAMQRFDKHRTGWYRWADVRLHLAHERGAYGPAYRELISDLQDDDLDDWALAVWATLQMHGLELPVVDDPSDLIPRFYEAGAAELWSLLTSEPSPTGCPNDPRGGFCIPGSLGWSIRHDAVDVDVIDRLRTTSLLDIRQGFAGSILAERAASYPAAADRTAYWLAVAPLTPAADLSMVTRTVVRSLQDQFARDPDSVCDDISIWKTRFENAAARARAPVLDRSRRYWVNFMDWWTEVGLDGLCSTPETFLAAAELHMPEANPWTHTVLPLVGDRILQTAPGTSEISLFQRSADLARELGDESTCTLWSLGISIGAARAGYFDAANDHLVRATNCLSNESEMHRTRNLVSAYLEFERAAGQNLIRDGGIEQKLARATRRQIDDGEVCIGLLPIGFDLDSQLPAAVMRIAERVQLEPAPHDNFSLRTASTFIAEGQAAYLTGLRDLHRGQLVTAALSLERARSNFHRIRHLPGLTRIQFLDQIVFDGQLKEIAESGEYDLEPASQWVEQLRGGHTRSILSEFSIANATSDGASAPLIAAFLIARRDDEIEETFSSSGLPESLCSFQAGVDADYYEDHADAPNIIIDNGADPGIDADKN